VTVKRRKDEKAKVENRIANKLPRKPNSFNILILIHVSNRIYLTAQARRLRYQKSKP
jgi:hypothetical protein|tara:strand:- start:1441 stop:1611 length:171 start_codon:yes stop_codon:yes gene_type:complete